MPQWLPGQSGNPEGARVKARRFADILNRAMVQEASKAEEDHRLRKGIEKILDKAAEGDLPSITMLADRLDGKPAQDVTIAGDEERPLFATITRRIIDAKHE